MVDVFVSGCKTHTNLCSHFSVAEGFDSADNSPKVVELDSDDDNVALSVLIKKETLKYAAGESADTSDPKK